MSIWRMSSSKMGWTTSIDVAVSHCITIHLSIVVRRIKESREGIGFVSRKEVRVLRKEVRMLS